MTQTALALAMLLAAGSPALAAEQFTCSFNEGCGTADCGADAPFDATLVPAATGWTLALDNETLGHFTEFDSNETARHFVSDDIDPDAGAAGLLSIFANGAAFLSLHGNFMTPSAQTHTGQCTKELS